MVFSLADAIRGRRHFLDFQNQKVFLIASDKVFWGRGTRLSTAGRQLFTDIAALLQTVPNRVVVSEYGLTDEEIHTVEQMTA